MASTAVFPNILKSLKTKTLKSEKAKTLQYFCCLLANQVETRWRHYLGQDSSSKYRNLVALATIPVYLIGSDTIDLSNFRSLVGMLKGPDALLEFKRVNNVLNFKFCDWISRRSQSMHAKAYGSVLFSASNLNLFMGFCRKDIWIRTD